MAKFDHKNNLPQIFKTNRVSILPISRSQYALGKFDTYYEIDPMEPARKNVTIPENLETLDIDNIYSESSAMHVAHISGMINDILEEECWHTVSGRMSTGDFDFQIGDLGGKSRHKIKVSGSQCEIDAGFESKNFFMIVEAKNYSVDNFLIRQLYYPYRLWERKLSKRIIPAFFTFSDNIFSFYVFRFEDLNDYNSIALQRKYEYTIGTLPLTMGDLIDVLNSTNIAEDTSVPFPQADKFERVMDLIGILNNNPLKKNDITETYQFDSRQTDYYVNATNYLGFSESKPDGYIELTDLGNKILSSNHKTKHILVTRSILKHGIFNSVIRDYLNTSNAPSLEEIKTKMELFEETKGLGNQTMSRRAQTIRSWVLWIIKDIVI
ncbi:MAG TPA: AAA-associated domain-containing protein [Caldisericia bacterium]|nr:AAA-associated domain-containing protein [Caldisericia bacterium]HPF48129.1 AAA-associated domain-containing protein [Caldisericia bacterium]HPI83934.1 AAA-associated domain-containing protein [Caldisericia bacterium]HPQ92582.1 AAA-associated domain-containing protein [Caldisericia bacterium]HRV74320.1 AAA-associated domain-containing protein [Caldisericia bacterium]